MQRLMRLTRPVCPGRHIFKVTLQGDQTVQLLQTQGGGGGGIFRCRAEPVPAPEIAFKADKALAGPQARLQRRASIARDQTDL